jgi:predicted metal-binding protein
MNKVRIGIIICHRYHTCAGGKCFRALQNREGAFSIYKDVEVEVAAFTTCGGCPGGNVEYAPEEMQKNGVTHVHLATGMVVGYPPCPRIDYFRRYLIEKFKMTVVVGTHPIPQKYFITHTNMKTWSGEPLQRLIQPTVCDESMRLKYD